MTWMTLTLGKVVQEALHVLPWHSAVGKGVPRRALFLRRLLALLMVALWAYHYSRSVRRVRLVFGQGRRDGRATPAEVQSKERLARIVDRCPTLWSIYWPTWYAYTAIMQFLLLGPKEFRAMFLQRSPYKREVVRLRDGGQVALDWVLPAAPKAADGHLPVVVLLHGAFQDSTSVTMSDMASDMAARGMPAVVMNRRGYGGINHGEGELKLTMFGFDEDLDDALLQVAKKQPGRPIAIVGFSCGSGFAGRYASNRAIWSAWAHQAPAAGDRRVGAATAANTASAADVVCEGGDKGAVVKPKLLCSVAYDPGYDVSPEGAVSRIKPPYSWVVNYALKYFYVFRHRGELMKKSESTARLVGDMLSPKSGAVETFRMGRRLSGVGGSSAWLNMQEVKVREIALPSLLINSRDDPICVWSNVEDVMDDIKANPNLVLADLERGAHGCKFDFWGINNVAHSMIAEFVLSAAVELKTGSAS